MKPLKNHQKNEMATRLGIYFDSSSHLRQSGNKKPPVQSYSSLTSTNTSPVSTLTGSSEADMTRPYGGDIGCESISSLLSVSLSGQSNASSVSPSRTRRQLQNSKFSSKLIHYHFN